MKLCVVYIVSMLKVLFAEFRPGCLRCFVLEQYQCKSLKMNTSVLPRFARKLFLNDQLSVGAGLSGLLHPVTIAVKSQKQMLT